MNIRNHAEMVKSTFLSLFPIYLIFDRFCTYFPINATCEALSDLYRTLVRRHWDMGRALLQFVEDAWQFRGGLAKCGDLTSGGFAVQFFSRQYLE